MVTLAQLQRQWDNNSKRYKKLVKQRDEAWAKVYAARTNAESRVKAETAKNYDRKITQLQRQQLKLSDKITKMIMAQRNKRK